MKPPATAALRTRATASASPTAVIVAARAMVVAAHVWLTRLLVPRIAGLAVRSRAVARPAFAGRTPPVGPASAPVG